MKAATRSRCLQRLLTPQTVSAGRRCCCSTGCCFPASSTSTWQDGRLFGSLIDVLNRGAPVAILAIGMTAVIATKGVDLSVGAVMAIVGRGRGHLVVAGYPAYVAVGAALAVGPALRALERHPRRRARHPADHRDAGPDGRGARHRAADHRGLDRHLHRSGADLHRHRLVPRLADADGDRLRADGARHRSLVRRTAHRPADRGGRRQPIRRALAGISQPPAAGARLRRSRASAPPSPASSSPPTSAAPMPTMPGSGSSSTPSSPSSSAAPRCWAAGSRSRCR